MIQYTLYNIGFYYVFSLTCMSSGVKVMKGNCFKVWWQCLPSSSQL